MSPEGGRRGAARAATLVLCGLAIAFLSSMCGIGGGLFAVPLLHYVYGLGLRRAVGTSLATVCVTATASTVLESLRDDSALHWGAVAALLSTSLVGAQLGYRTANRIDTKRLKIVFVVVLFVVGFKVLLEDAVPVDLQEGVGAALGLVDYLKIAGFGLLAGFVAPLLGIGGGLVAVPALFLGVPQLGYLGARACSLAMGAVTSGRSLWMYARDGRTDFWTAAWLAAGALGGSAAGVHAVHLDGATQYARVLMGCILSAVGVRFLLDVLRMRGEAERAPGA